MVNVGVKAPDIGFQAADSGKSAGTGVKSVQSDQFKKLLQGKQDDSQDISGAKEVSKNAKREKTEAPKKSKEDSGKDSKGEVNEESVQTDDSQAQGLLAAYQLAQGLRPEVLSTEPEIVVEMPETDLGVSAMEMGEITGLSDMQTVLSDAGAAQQVQTALDGVQAENGFQGTIQVKETAVQEIAPETVQAEPIQREAVKTASGEDDSQAQAGDHQAEQSAAAPIAQAPVKVMEDNVKPQDVTTIYVPQTEELPDKLADQLLAKMADGAQSFEIEIEPENLGKIAVKILYQDGQATVSIFCTEKRALDVLGNHAREIGSIIDRNLGGETKIIVEKQEPDYLNQNRDENQQGKQGEQEQQKENNRKNNDTEDSEQFLQKLRLGLTV